MSLWKKVGGAVVSTSLAASLLLTVAGTALANTAPMALSGVCVPAGCSQVAATGSISMAGNNNTVAGALPAPTRLQISGAGASFIGVTGPAFTLISTFTSGGAGEFYVAGDVQVNIATVDASGSTVKIIGASAGTATITEQRWVAASSQWAPDGNSWTLTFTSASTFQVAASQSTVQTSTAASAVTGPPATCGTAQTSAAAGTAATGAVLCVIVRNAAGTALSGVTVSGSIQPFGLVAGGQSYSGTSDVNGFVAFPITATGLAGATTITANATFLGVTTALPSVTFTFTGSLAKLTLSNVRYIYGQGEAASRAIKVVGTDTAGNVLDLTAQCLIGNVTSGTTLTGLTLTAGIYATDGACYISAATAANAAFGTTAITFSSTDDTIVSNSVNLGVSDVADSITAAFDKTTVVPGGTAKFMATLKDSAGRLAPDTTSVLTVASSGVAVDSTGATTTKTSNGVATFTFLAPFNAGTASVTAFNADAGSASAAITVGAPAPLSPFAPTTSALGNTTTGPFSFSTKIQAKGGYITWKVDGGATLAGKTLQVWVYKKYTATGAWAGPTMLTTRVANASGVAYINIISRGVLWLSLRPVLPATTTDAAVWGPTSIGRWR